MSDTLQTKFIDVENIHGIWNIHSQHQLELILFSAIAMLKQGYRIDFTRLTALQDTSTDSYVLT